MADGGSERGKILLAAIVAELCRLHAQAHRLKIDLQLPAQRGGGGAAAEQQGPAAEGGDGGQGITPGPWTPAHLGRGDGMAAGSCRQS